MIRILIHQTHLLCLLANGRRRNQWISHPKLSSVALSLVPNHIADSVQADCENPVKEVNALQVLALWWRDSFVVTGPGIHHRELDSDVADFEVNQLFLLPFPSVNVTPTYIYTNERNTSLNCA